MTIEEIKNKYKSIPIQVKASIMFLMCSFLQRGISVITTPIFTRLLSSAEYGQYSVFNTWLSIITVFVSLNLSLGVYTQGLVKFEEEQNIFSSSLQGLTLFMTFFWTIVYFAFRNFWNELFHLNTTQMLLLLLMIWTSAAFNFWSAEQRVKLKYKQLVLITLIVSFFKPIIGILLVVYSDDKVTARILGLALVELIGYTGCFIAQISRGKTLYSAKYWKYALMFNIPLVPHYLSQTVLNGADRIMIVRMAGESEAGIYSLAYSISLIMTMFNGALSQTLSPWIYRKIKEHKEEDITKISFSCLLGIAVINLLLIAFAPEAVKIFAPKEYYDAIYIIPPVAMSVYFMFSYDLFAKFEFFYEKTKYISIGTFICAAINVALNYIFIKLFGYRAAGYTTLFCYIIYAAFHYYFMKKICHDNSLNKNVYDIRYYSLISLIFLALGFFFLIIYDQSIVRYSCIFALFIISYSFRKRIIMLYQTIRNK